MKYHSVPVTLQSHRSEDGPVLCSLQYVSYQFLPGVMLPPPQHVLLQIAQSTRWTLSCTGSGSLILLYLSLLGLVTARVYLNISELCLFNNPQIPYVHLLWAGLILKRNPLVFHSNRSSHWMNVLSLLDSSLSLIQQEIRYNTSQCFFFWSVQFFSQHQKEQSRS